MTEAKVTYTGIRPVERYLCTSKGYYFITMGGEVFFAPLSEGLALSEISEYGEESLCIVSRESGTKHYPNYFLTKFEDME